MACLIFLGFVSILTGTCMMSIQMCNRVCFAATLRPDHVYVRKIEFVDLRDSIQCGMTSTCHEQCDFHVRCFNHTMPQSFYEKSSCAQLVDTYGQRVCYTDGKGRYTAGWPHTVVRRSTISIAGSGLLVLGFVLTVVGIRRFMAPRESQPAQNTTVHARS